MPCQDNYKKVSISTNGIMVILEPARVLLRLTPVASSRFHSECSSNKEGSIRRPKRTISTLLQGVRPEQG